MPSYLRSTLSLTFAAALALSGYALAQAPGETPAKGVSSDKVPAYDVVSIKPNKSGSGNVSIHTDDGNFDATNVSLKNMLLNAYGLKEAQLVDLPAWGDSTRFDIRAKILEPDLKILGKLSADQWRSMLQPILTDRFALKFHTESKVLPVYELVINKGGPKFQVSASPQHGDSINTHNRNLVATSVPMTSIADWLSSQVQRVVIDKTGLTGKYDLALKWSADDGPPPEADAPPPLITALQEQLGLRLQPAHDSVQTFVIDHVELPTEN